MMRRCDGAGSNQAFKNIHSSMPFVESEKAQDSFWVLAGIYLALGI